MASKLPASQLSVLEEYRQSRLKRCEMLRGLGIDPYPASAFLRQAIANVREQPVGMSARVAGRLMLFRLMGKIAFGSLKDSSGTIQIMFSRAEFRVTQAGADFDFWMNCLDVGDVIGIEGDRFTTKSGETSILVRQLTLLTKSIRPLPDKYSGIQDEDERFRRRYLDILFNRDVQETIRRKSVFWNSIRRFLLERDFIEVYTPTLEVTTGGADARPFKTWHNTFSMDVYLRISQGELWQKRLMVAGMEKTFEIGRQFRNEGISAEHANDYDQMEFYWAYADAASGMDFVQDMFRYFAQETFGTTSFSLHRFGRECQVDLSERWERYDYVSTVESLGGVNVLTASLDELRDALIRLGDDPGQYLLNRARLVDRLWKLCRKQLDGPGFLVNEPLIVSPLAKCSRDNPGIVERFHVIIAGSELGNGYSELNDPVDQESRFAEQERLRAEGDDEAQMHDRDFIEALEYGMPPTCGFGLSERVFAFLSNKSIRECQTFPLMRPLKAPV